VSAAASPCSCRDLLHGCLVRERLLVHTLYLVHPALQGFERNHVLLVAVVGRREMVALLPKDGVFERGHVFIEIVGLLLKRGRFFAQDQ